MSFLFVHSKIFSSLPASAKPSMVHISNCKPVVPCGHIVVSSLHCGCSKPVSSCGGGFFDADPGNPQHCKFPRSLTSVSLSSLFGHEIGCTWALTMILRDYFCLQPAICLGCRKAAQDSSEL